jgi:hypothetical protein
MKTTISRLATILSLNTTLSTGHPQCKILVHHLHVQLYLLVLLKYTTKVRINGVKEDLIHKPMSCPPCFAFINENSMPAILIFSFYISYKG